MRNATITIAADKNKTGSDLHKANLLKMIQGKVNTDWIEFSKSMKCLYQTGKYASYKKRKSEAPIIMPSGIFKGSKGKDNLVKHSGYLSIDIDPDESNSHISDWSHLKDQISTIVNVAYIGHSLSGKGLWGLIPLSIPEQASVQQSIDIHENRAAALIKDFAQYKIHLDPSCKNVNRLRYYAYDPDGYINTTAKPYNKEYKSKLKELKTYSYQSSESDFHKLLNKIIDTATDITQGYDNWLKVGFAIHSEYGEAGREYFHAVSQFNPEYCHSETEKKYSSFSNGDGINIESFFWLCKEHNITLK